MSLATYKQIFADELWNFGLPALRHKVISAKEFIKEVGCDTIAAVAQGLVLFNLDYLNLAATIDDEYDQKVFLAATQHEDGHPFLPYSAPGTFRNKLDDAKAVGKLLGDKKLNTNAVWDMLNIAYDMIIDIMSHDRVGYDPRPIIATFHKKSPSQPRDLIGQSLIAFREEMMGERFSGYDLEDMVREAVRKVIKIVRDPSSAEKPRQRVLDICRILVELYTSEDGEPGEGEGGEGGESDEDSDNDSDNQSESEGESKPSKKPKKGKKSNKKPKKGKPGNLTEEELQELAQALEEALEEMGITEAQTQEDLTDDPTEAKMKQVDMKDSEDREAARNAMKLSDDEAAFEMLWMTAEERVRLQNPCGSIGEGSAYSAGSVPWAPGMPLRELNIENTLLGGGVFLPGVTTVQDYVVQGPGMPIEGTSTRKAVSVDFSGSIQQGSPVRAGRNHDMALIAVFAVIHEAKRKKVPVLVNLFGDYNYTIEWSTDYKKIAREAFENSHRAGGGNSCSGITKKMETELIKPGDTLIYATDFYLLGSEEKASRQLKKFIADGVQVIFIAMFDHCAQEAGIPFVECRKLEDFEEICLASVQ